ncbi:MAG TPA: choice-of-anchor tandem repeat GloVer-containing protein [Bryobacteraceae bacterium]|nr:choice-of-anchor tandem repeat GloVer-containing protein [Bryobacteraceae bacterium]
MRLPKLRTCGTLLAALLAFGAALAAQAPPPTLTTIYNFAGGGDGSGPNTGVVVGPGGVLYGDTGSAGTADSGTAFSLTPPSSPGALWTASVYSFPGGKAGSPSSGPLALANGGGELFGAGAGNNAVPAAKWLGAVYLLHPSTSPGGAWTNALLHEFSGAPGDGQAPNSVVVGSGGVLYGTTQYGGSGPCNDVHPGCGTVFSLAPPSTPGGPWTETVLYNFAGAPNDGSGPTANLVVGSGGVLYGTTASGGSNYNSGTAFSLTPPSSPGDAWTENVLYNFPPTFYGCQPGQLIAGRGGILYGVAPTCGPGTNDGTVFSLTPLPSGESKHATLYAFTGGSTDGAGPNSLVEVDGVLYGTTAIGGPGNLRSGGGNGTLFSLTPPETEGGTWTEAVLYFFTGGSDGATPEGIAAGPDGVLYGATHGGGMSGFGTVFSFTPWRQSPVTLCRETETWF